MEKQRPLIGVLINEPDRSFYSRALYYIQKELFAADMDAAIFSTLMTRSEDMYIDAENAVFDLVNFDIIDGLIVFNHTFNSEKIREQITDRIRREFKKPVVFVEDIVEGFDHSCFSNDEGTARIAEHLVKCHGVKDVAYVSGPESESFHSVILESFRNAFRQNGVEILDKNVFFGNDWLADLSPAVNAIMESGLPDAIVCSSDFIAAAVISNLSERGVKIPADVIVTGYYKNEPLCADYLNITSVTRNPQLMAVTAARKLISKITGCEYEPELSVSTSTLETGVTCGCTEINYSALARSARDKMLYTRRDGFESYYNFMSEELNGAVDFNEYLWRLDWYTFYLGDIEGFWLCLNDNVMHQIEDPTEYTEHINIPYMKYKDDKSVSPDMGFEKSQMLPAIFEKRDKPCAFIFNPLHFSNINFGYTVISYGDSGSIYDASFNKWLRYVTCALEKHRRHMIYKDTVMNAQIRDSLTGLLNMKGFKRTMTEQYARNAGSGKLLRIISIDVDNLSGINSAYGYSEGDRMLQRLAVILNNCAGDDDICVRVSGDEFLIAGVLDADVPVDEVPVNLERNLAAYNSSNSSDYGIYLYTARVTAPFTSLETLDTLPYEAAYQRTMTKDNHNKAKKISSSAASDDFDPEERQYVSKLLNDNLLTYHFQPIIDAKTGEIFAYEALMRSAGEVKISPIAILDHAEALGRLGDVERLTMTNLFDYLYNHQEQFENKSLFVNSIPSCILPDKDFEELYAKYSSILPKVVVEFTEQTEASSEQVDTIVERSKKMDFKIAIDDYGTGYSNISNLLTLLPNYVKIDRSLIMNIHEDRRKQHFTQNIIDYAHDNDFKVLAEGVEVAEELKMVISMGIDLIQGYYTAKPSPEIISEIDTYIVDEIVEMNRASENKRVKKTYFTGNEDELSLIALDFDDYTDIFVSKERFAIRGAANHVSETKIQIKDGLECTLDLHDVSMKNDNTEPCISLGSGSKLTLNICGNVQISGAINVPETAELKIVGDGSLTIESSSNQTYGIGTDSTKSYGNIGLYLDNRLKVHLDSDKCSAIGGGFNNRASKIDIETKELLIELSGKEVLGIGCMHSVATVNIRNTKLTVRQQCADGIAVGSFDKSIDVRIASSEISFEASGNNIGGICSFDVKGNSVNIDNSKLDMVYKGKTIHAIGSEKGDMNVTMHDCDLNIVCEGAEAYAIGSESKESRLSLYKCRGMIHVTSGNGTAIKIPEQYIIYDECELDITSV